ncbi:MAG: AAA-like domain-containing protein [Cyanobacteria bacterium Co-bin13]|nr:AAA-like domain-containing protein [Cyanobacteria bacterium Co-bin13]
MISPKRKRRRGIILTPEGFKKLQQAKQDAEFTDNRGQRYTLEALSERTGLAVDTLMKIFACEAGVDKQTLKLCYSAFDLTLDPSDFSYPDPAAGEAEADDISLDPDLPGGQVPLGSTFYVERSAIESTCYRAVLQPGGLIRIKAPRRMGKTSLMSRILQAARPSCQTVALSFQLADKAIFQNLDPFLQWFCANVGLGLGLPSRLSDYWDDLFGSKISCKIYFEQYLLPQLDQPLVLALDDVDRLFQYPDLADEFFGLLRAWHEEAKNRDLWKQLRLIVAHASEVYIPLNVNQSPFNVGLPIELKAFSTEQVRHLARHYGLSWTTEQTERLMGLVDGQPYLVQLALYHLWQEQVTLAQILGPEKLALGIYGDHLQRQLWQLQQQPTLAAAYARVVSEAGPAELELVQAFQLQSLGLAKLQGNRASPSCALYAQYFRDRLGEPQSA